MARERVEKVTCDRCKKVFEENTNDATQSVGGPRLTLESFAGDASFEDLCPRCEKRVEAVVESLLLAKDDEQEPKAAKKSNKKSKKDKAAKDAPPVPQDEPPPDYDDGEPDQPQY